MDIVFNCPNCDQELAVDQSGAGSEIECPSCNQTITIPATGKVTTGSLPPVTPPPPSAPSAIASSAAAKVALHLKVPVSDKPGASLIEKPKPPLEVAARGEKKVRIHTIRRAQCIESGHDKFDEVVTRFLNEVGEPNITGIHTINYEQFDVGTQKIMTDYGVLIVYRG
jgi:DNA-directed RNA polymerase subunit RPC12/RpoP